MKDKISKFFNVLKRDGFLKTLKKTYKYFMANYFNKINIVKKLDYIINKNKYSGELNEILSNCDYDRVFVWRGSFGWNVPLFQRPQHIARQLSDKKTLIFYEVTRMTDKVKFIKKEKDNLYLINYEIKDYENMVIDKINKIDKPKYLQLYSTCWDVTSETLNKYINNNFKVVYEYIDDLNPKLAGTNKLPENVKYIHNWVSKNVADSIVIVSADKLEEDIIKKRKSKDNIIFASNGVDYNFFRDCNKDINIHPKLKEIKKEYKKIIGYYGALAVWFDYDLLKKVAQKFPEYAFVLFGIKYDTSFDEANLEECNNIYFLGPINYDYLPYNANYFDVCMIPFAINDITLATNPLKVFEYMAMHKPIITTPMPECMKYKSVNIAKNATEFIKILKDIDKINTKDYVKLLDKEAKINSWEEKANEITEKLGVYENKGVIK